MNATLSRAPVRMRPYAWWQLRDYAWERGLPSLIVACLFGFLAAMPVRQVARQQPTAIPAALVARYGSAALARDALVAEENTRVLRGFVGSIVFLGALFAMNGLVANDRKQGFYRFLFAKAVSPARYYGQAFMLHAAGFLVVILMLCATWSAFVAPALSRELVFTMWIVYLCYAGLAFLLTAAARWDWLSLVAVSVASQLLWSRFGESPGAIARLLYLLPPITRVEALYDAALLHQPLAWRTLAWFAGYGVACFAAGLVVLRHRRLATP